MNEVPIPGPADLCLKIARLIEEKGWNQEDFASISGLNRQTVRQILQPTGDRTLRNSTVAACARALGLNVLDLRSLPLDRLLARIREQPMAGDELKLQRLYEVATQPELRAWMERNPDRAKGLTADEMDELLSLQGVGGPLNSFGVEQFVTQIERRRVLLERIRVIANTEYLDVLEQLVGLMFDKVQPYRDRV